MNLPLAEGDSLTFALLLFATVSIPGIGLVVTGAAVGKHGLNPWCAWAGVSFFAILLGDMVIWTLGSNGSFSEGVMVRTLIGGIGFHALSALISLRGLAQMRTRRKWHRGRSRAFWFFWLNIAAMAIIGLWCLTHVNPTLYYQFQPSSD